MRDFTDAPSPRLCTIVKNAPDEEYGFNLHAERSRGQFIGAVDPDSAAQRAGLRSGDRIFVVNGEPISQISHKEVVSCIKSNPMRCQMLVIDELGARWYFENQIPIDMHLPNIVRVCAPPFPSNDEESQHIYTNYTGGDQDQSSSIFSDASLYEPHFTNLSLAYSYDELNYSNNTPVYKNERVISRARAQLKHFNEKQDYLTTNNSAESIIIENCKMDAVINTKNTDLNNEKIRSLQLFIERLERRKNDMYEQLSPVRSHKTFNYFEIMKPQSNNEKFETLEKNQKNRHNTKIGSKKDGICEKSQTDNHHYYNYQKNNANDESDNFLKRYEELLDINGEMENEMKKAMPNSEDATKNHYEHQLDHLYHNNNKEKKNNESVFHSMVAKSAVAPSPPTQAVPRPRLCKLIKFSPTEEFGFNLHAENGKGHFIGAVDEGGIAQASGLETGQRIVGVNGRLVYPNTPHSEVVAYIKQNPLCTELLVASEAVDRWYTENCMLYSYDHVSTYESQRFAPEVDMRRRSVAYVNGNNNASHNSNNNDLREQKDSHLDHYNGTPNGAKLNGSVHKFKGSNHNQQWKNGILNKLDDDLVQQNTAYMANSHNKIVETSESRAVEPTTVIITVANNNTTSIRLNSISEALAETKLTTHAIDRRHKNMSEKVENQTKENQNKNDTQVTSKNLLDQVFSALHHTAVDKCQYASNDYIDDEEEKSRVRAGSALLELNENSASIKTENTLASSKNKRILSTSNDDTNLTSGDLNKSASRTSSTAKSVPLVVPPKHSNVSLSESTKKILRNSSDSATKNTRNDNNMRILYDHTSTKDENLDIFKMSAYEALRAVRLRSGTKKTKDQRLHSNLSLEDKHRLIADL